MGLKAAVSPDPDEIMRRQNTEAADAWKEFESRLSPWQRLTLAPRARWLLRRIKQFYVWRELVRSELVRIALPIRLLHLELARRFVERGWIESTDDYFCLTTPDVDAHIDNRAPATSLSAIVGRRKAEWAQLAKIDMSLLMKESQLPAIVRRGTAPAARIENATELHGLAVSSGFVEAEVIVMHDPREFSRMKPGTILVAPATDPSWTPLFTLAAGVIVEVGGILSHASTVAREYGLPALANVKHATRILKDGDRVRLDATNGVVQILGSTEERETAAERRQIVAPGASPG
ncbi:MAG TPA: PEP-utilizing enzyme [Terriglobia bacterium]|nr:PEP-utilizing enzyme [Terriglobia bacterium]